MLDPIVNFFTWVFQWIGRGIGFVIGIILWPFMWAGRWYVQRGWILKAVLGVAIVGLVGLYAYFFWTTQVWTNFNPGLCRRLQVRGARRLGRRAGGHRGPAPSTAKTCGRSAHRRRRRRPDRLQRQPECLDLVDDPLQARAVRHATGTTRRSSTTRPRSSAASTRPCAARRRNSPTISAACAAPRRSIQNLQDARGNIQFDEYTWYFGINPFGPKTPTPSYYRSAIKDLRTFNDRLRSLQCGVRCARRQSDRSSSTASPATSARPRRSSRTAPRTTTTAGSIRAPTTASGSPTASSMATTG